MTRSHWIRAEGTSPSLRLQLVRKLHAGNCSLMPWLCDNTVNMATYSLLAFPLAAMLVYHEGEPPPPLLTSASDIALVAPCLRRPLVFGNEVHASGKLFVSSIFFVHKQALHVRLLKLLNYLKREVRVRQ